jgi:hypothetical protein
MTEPDTRLFHLFDSDGKEIMTGSMSAIMERLPSTKARDAALADMLRIAVDSVEAEQKRDEAVRSTVQMLSDVTAHLSARMDAYIARREKQRREDEQEAGAEEQRQIEAMLDGLPDFDNPEANQLPDPLLVPDPQMPSSLTEQDTDLPVSSVPMSNVQDPTLGSDPTYNFEELAHPQKQPQQPVSISLNEED